jgi:hypothetical protein
MNSTTAVENLLERVRAWCGEHLQVTSVEEAEQLAVAVARQVGQVIVSEGVQQTAGRASYENCSVPCACGRRARFMGYRQRWVSTLAGDVPVRRAYYYGRPCRQGQSPGDRRQGLTQRQWTPGTKSLIAHCCGRMPFAEAVALLELTTGLHVEVYSAEQIVAEVGEQLRKMQAAAQARARAGEVPAGPEPAARRSYVGFAGTSGHIDRAWHEIKTGVIYTGTPDAAGSDEATDCH